MQLDLTYDQLKMTDDEALVLNVIETYRGREHPIPARNLADIVCIPERRIRSIVRRLRITFHKPIGSTTQQPAGYYLCITPEEIQNFTESWFNFALKHLKMVHTIRKDERKETLNKIEYSLFEA